MATTITDINWRQCEKLGAYSFLTMQDHVIRITKHSIPLVFIPGIMGTRLRGPSGKGDSQKVWDPNDLGFMWKYWIKGDAHAHKNLLIDQQSGIQVITAENSPDDKKRLIERFKKSSNTQMNWDWLPLPAMGSPGAGTAEQRKQKIAELLAEHGWGQVALGFYEKILYALAQANFGRLHRCFVFPVYARGYNWVGDNDLSGAYLTDQIQKIIEAESKIPGRECDKVILVTHSMGGLAARSAMKLHGAEKLCFGAIHGAQPVTGAPLAYREMRGGAEGTFDPSAYVVGHTSALVLPVMGGCIGGLELLPTKLYQTDGGSSAWLSQTDAQGKIIGKALPSNGDPYSEIYLADQGFLRLVLHPELLDPSGQEKPENNKYGGASYKPLQAYKTAVSQAESFHDRLQLKAHAKTAFSYVQGGKATYDTVVYNNPTNLIRPQYSPDGIPLGEAEETQEEGSGTDLDTTWNPKAYFSIAKRSGTGDGTVPVSSGRALPTTFRPSPPVNGIEHSDFYNHTEVQDFTIKSIAMLAEAYRKSQVG